MPDLTLTLTDMAHGGLALGRDKSGRAVFVPFAIPGETVRLRAHGQQPSQDRSHNAADRMARWLRE